MKFCAECGSYMKETKEGYLCRKCGILVRGIAETRVRNAKETNRSGSVFVVDGLDDEYPRVPQVCPKCGNTEAFRWFSGVSGEHAGIRRERTIEHFKCTKCAHSWARSS